MTGRKKPAAKTALVVEGGGMRGIFCAGVLDVFLENRFDPFDLYIGVSAGACNLASHLAGQQGRNYWIYTNMMTRPEFISMKKFITGGHYMDLDYLWRAIDVEYPLSVNEIIKRKKNDFTIVGTVVGTGTAAYLRPRAETCSEALKASSAVPLLYRGFLEIDATPLVDGGVADPIPAREAYRRGARTIVVMRTRPAVFRKHKGLENHVSAFATRRWPQLSAAVREQAATYGRCMDFIETPPPGVTVLQIAPGTTLRTGRTTQDMALLREDYERGRRHGEEFIGRWGSRQ